MMKAGGWENGTYFDAVRNLNVSPSSGHHNSTLKEQGYVYINGSVS